MVKGKLFLLVHITQVHITRVTSDFSAGRGQVTRVYIGNKDFGMRLRSSWNHLSKILGRPGTEYRGYIGNKEMSCPEEDLGNAIYRTRAKGHFQSKTSAGRGQTPRVYREQGFWDTPSIKLPKIAYTSQVHRLLGDKSRQVHRVLGKVSAGGQRGRHI